MALNTTDAAIKSIQKEQGRLLGEINTLRERVNRITLGESNLISLLGSGSSGVSDHGLLTGLADDDHTQYALTTHAFVTVGTEARFASERSLGTAGNGISWADGGAGGTIVANIVLASPSGLEFSTQQLRLADTIAGAGLTISGKVLAVGTGAGLTVNADDVALTTPGTLSVSSTNLSTGSHTHAITSSSNPGAAAAILASNASGHLQLVRIGLNTTPGYPVHASFPTEQMRLEYNASNFASFTVASTGTLTIGPSGSLNLDPAGDVVFNPVGNDAYPSNNYDLNLGLINKKWLTLHAAELWVETLVAQETVATIGGRVVVAPTTTLIADLSSSIGTPLTITAAALTSSINTADLSVYTTASVSPTAGRVQFIAVVGNETGSTPAVPTVTGAGLTWSLVTSQTYNDNAGTFTRRVCLFVGSGTPSTGALTITFAATQLRCGWAVVEFTNVDTVSPVVQSASTRLETDTPNFSGLSLSTYSHASNAGFAIFSTDVTNATTQEAGWTELVDQFSDTLGLEVAWTATPDTTITATSGGNADWGVIACELRNAGLATTIDVKHNQMRTGDRAFMQSGGKLEFLSINSNSTAISGGFRYTVTRNLDGTGANDWYAGDAVVNTGQVGSGFIDMYSFESINGRVPSYIFNFDATGSVYSQNYNGSANWTLFGDGANTQVNDAIYFGVDNTPWANLFATIGTAGVYSVTLVCEYWNGAWTAFSPSQAPDFAAAGQTKISWDQTALTGWVATTVNTFSAYWIRIRISAFTSFTTQPVISGQRVHHEKGQVGPTIVGWRRNSLTFNDITEHWAIGNLNGLYGYSTDVMGMAVGRYSPITAWVGADDTSGVRMMVGDTQMSRWFNNGDLLIGQQASGQSNVFITSGGVRMRTNATVKIDLQSDGDIFVGTDTSAAATTGLSIFSSAQTYNGEAGFATGDILIGDNSAGQANLFWDKSTGRLNFRGGTATQLYVDTDGSLVAGSGNVILNAAGIQLLEGLSNVNMIRWLSGVNDVWRHWVQDTGASTSGNLQTIGINATFPRSLLSILATSAAGNDRSGVLFDNDYRPFGSSTGPAVVFTGRRAGAFALNVVFETGTLISVNQTTLATAIIDVAVTGNGQGIRSDVAFIGRGANGSNYGQFSHWNFRNTLASYALLQDLNGASFLNAAAGQSIFLRINNATVGQIRPDNTTYLESLGVGINAAQTAGNVAFTGNLISRKSLVNYTVYGVLPLPAGPLTVFSATTFSTVAASTLLSAATLGVPTSARMILVQLATSDGSGIGRYFACGPTSANWGALVCRTQVAAATMDACSLIPCGTSGELYYRTSASGASSLTVSMIIWGYCI